MKRSLLMVAVVVGMIAAWSVGRLQGQAQGDKVIFVSSSHANYTAMQPGNPAVTAAAVWGDATAGAHGTFSKFAPGYDAGMHTHTNDVWIEVEYDQMVTLTPGLKGHVTIRGRKPDTRTGQGRASPRPSGGPQFPSAQPPVASEAVVEIHHRTCAGQDRERRMPSGR